MSSRLLKEGRARFWAFIEGKIKDLVEFRGNMRSDKFPEEWAECRARTYTSHESERTARRFPVYVESICVRNFRLEAVGNKVKLAQGESNRILLAVPRESVVLSGNVIEALGSKTCQGR